VVSKGPQTEGCFHLRVPSAKANCTDVKPNRRAASLRSAYSSSTDEHLTASCFNQVLKHSAYAISLRIATEDLKALFRVCHPPNLSSNCHKHTASTNAIPTVTGTNEVCGLMVKNHPASARIAVKPQ
jgi:hypothetical protein